MELKTTFNNLLEIVIKDIENVKEGNVFEKFILENKDNKEIKKMLLEDTISLYFIYDFKYIIEIIKNLKYKHFESFNETVLKNESLIISLLNDKKIDKKSMAYEFKFVSEDIRSNLNFMKNYIYENPYLYSYCFGDIKRDYELTKFVLSKDGIILGNCYQYIKEDKEMCKIAIDSNCYAMSYISYKFKDDFDFVLETVKKYPLMLEFASNRLKSNEKIVTEAVKLEGMALQFASDVIKKDVEITKLAIYNNIHSFQFVKELMYNKEFIKNNLLNNNNFKLVLDYIPLEIKEDKEINTIIKEKLNKLKLETRSDILYNKKCFIVF